MIYFAPLQGYTDFIYRQAFSRNFRGIGSFYIPYLSFRNETVPLKQMREVLPENNKNCRAIPQVLVKNSTEALLLFKTLEDYGYSEININMGCPYPMVTSRGRGAGLLPLPGNIREILDNLLPGTKSRISVKLRSGLKSEDEIYPVIEVLNQYPLTEIIYHPRLASQLYKGSINESLFRNIVSESVLPVSYNGDIFSVGDFERKKELPGKVSNWMIGRGFLMNPFLPAEINGEIILPSEKARILKIFHDELVDDYSKVLSGPGHLLMRMQQFWEFFSHSFPDQGKTYKMIRKCNTMNDYFNKTGVIFDRLKND